MSLTEYICNTCGYTVEELQSAKQAENLTSFPCPVEGCGGVATKRISRFSSLGMTNKSGSKKKRITYETCKICEKEMTPENTSFSLVDIIDVDIKKEE